MSKERKKFIKFAVLGIIIIIVLIGIASWYVLNGQTKYQNQGAGMSPTLTDGQIITGVEKAASEVNRGDIIVFKPHVTDVERMIKRVVGLAGDKIVMSNGKITVTTSDGGTYEPNLPESNSKQEINTIVPEGTFYVIGDNLDNSLDSRSFGPVPIENLLSVIDARLF